MDLPKIDDCVEFGTESSNMKEYYERQTKMIEEMKLETMKEQQKEESVGIYEWTLSDQQGKIEEQLWVGENVLYDEEGKTKLIW